MNSAIVVFSHPTKRRAERAATLRLISERSDTAIVPTVWMGAGADPVADFMELLAAPFLDGADLVFLEDDIEPCRNAVPYMDAWESPHLTSFYNPGRAPGLAHGFTFSQAIKIPKWLVERMRREPFPPPHAKLQRDGVDSVVHRFLHRWGLGFFQHVSLVQHAGAESTWTPSTLSGPGRRAVDWPGADFDAWKLRGSPA